MAARKSTAPRTYELHDELGCVPGYFEFLSAIKNPECRQASEVDHLFGQTRVES
jgi:hypothetical protein